MPVLVLVGLMMMMISTPSVVDGQELDTRILLTQEWGSGANSQLYYPFGIAVDQTSGNVYVADTFNQHIQVFTRTGNFIGVWSVGATYYLLIHKGATIKPKR
jgi:DNA-binding beta-propeller fold protein YncE